MTISVVVPCFNEEESIPLFYEEMERVRISMGEEFEYIFINDGSSDKTLDVLRELNLLNPCAHYLSFSRNFGKEAALYAGLQYATGDYVTVMDVDLQDPPELLIEMKQKLDQQSNLDCVGTRRVTRDGEPPIRSFFARMFYKLINKISQVEMVDGARDFRLMRRPMVDAILELSEYNRFSKGIFAWVGFETEYLEYNFSDAPLNIAFIGGLLSWILAFIMMVLIVIRTLVFGDPTSGWPSLMTVILFLGGFQLLTIGILGKYIGKIFLETKNRPVYVIKEKSK